MHSSWSRNSTTVKPFYYSFHFSFTFTVNCSYCHILLCNKYYFITILLRPSSLYVLFSFRHECEGVQFTLVIIVNLFTIGTWRYSMFTFIKQKTTTHMSLQITQRHNILIMLFSRADLFAEILKMQVVMRWFYWNRYSFFVMSICISIEERMLFLLNCAQTTSRYV